MKRFIRLKWILPPVAIGISSLVAFQVVSCGAASKEEIKLGTMTFKSVAELSEWAKNNLKTSDINKEAQWSIFDGEKNRYFDTPMEVRDFLEKNIDSTKGAYISRSIEEYLDTSNQDNKGRILDYPLSDDVNSIQNVYRGVNGLRFVDLDSAVSSMLQIHSAYFFDNHYFLNKESLEFYLRGDSSRSTDWSSILNWQNSSNVLRTSIKNEDRFSENIDITNINSESARRVVKNFVTANDTKKFYDKSSSGDASYIDIDENSLQRISSVPYLRTSDSGKGSFVLDISRETNGTLFAPYIFETEGDPNGIVNRAASWQKSSQDMSNIRQKEAIGASINSAYSIIFHELGFSTLTNSLFDENSVISTEEKNVFSENDYTEKSISDFRNLFGNIKIDGVLIKDKLLEYENSLSSGKRYGLLTSLPILRSMLLKWSMDAKLRDNYINAINNAFDSILKIVDFKSHEIYDEFMSEDAKSFKLSNVFMFDTDNVQFHGTYTYIQSIINNKSFDNSLDNKGGVEFSLVANSIIGYNSLIDSQKSLINKIIDKYSDEKANERHQIDENHTKFNGETFKEYSSKRLRFKMPKNYGDIDNSINEFKRMFNEIKEYANYLNYDIGNLDSIDSSIFLIKQIDNYLKVPGYSSLEFQRIVSKIDAMIGDQDQQILFDKVDYSKHIEFGNITYNKIFDQTLQEEIINTGDDELISSMRSVLNTTHESLSMVNDVAKEINSKFTSFCNLAKTKNFTTVTTKIENAISKEFKAIDNLFKISKFENRATSFLNAFSKIASVSKFVSRVNLFVSAVSFIVELGFSIADAVNGQYVADTYEFHDPSSGSVFYWNGGSHREHKFHFLFIDIDFGTSDTVDASSIKWVDMSSIQAPSKSGYYSNGEFYSDINEVKQNLITSIVNGELNELLAHQIILSPSNISAGVIPLNIYGRTIDEIVDKILKLPNLSDYISIGKIDALGNLLVSSSALLEENIKTVLTNIKPILIAQLPILNGKNFVQQEFMIPSTHDKPLFPTTQQPSLGNREYFIYDPNSRNFNYGVQTPNRSEEDVRSMFIERFKSIYSVEGKQALKFDVPQYSNFDDIPSLIKGRMSNDSDLLSKIYEVVDFQGNSAKFLTYNEAYKWLLASVNFTSYQFNSESKWYEWENTKFTSITEFVNWVLAKNREGVK